MIRRLRKLITTYGPIDEVVDELDQLAVNNTMRRAVEEMNRIRRDIDVDVVILDQPWEDLNQLNQVVRDYTDRGLSVSVQKRVPKKLRYRELVRIENGEVKPSDVAIYVERGAADVGVGRRGSTARCRWTISPRRCSIPITRRMHWQRLRIRWRASRRKRAWMLTEEAFW